MKRSRVFFTIFSAVSLTLLLAVVVIAADDKLTKDTVAKKWLEMDKYGNVNGVKGLLKDMCYDCGDILQCPYGTKAVHGEPDAKYNEVWKDLLYFWDDKLIFPVTKYGSCSLGLTQFLGGVVWGVPEAGDLLAKTIDSDKKLDDLVCSDKKYVYRALWYLGDKKHADVMIEGFKNHDCTTSHMTDTLAVLHTWNLSDKQNKKIEEICLAAFQGTGSKDKDKVKGCARYLGNAGSKNKDAIEFLQNFLGGNNKVHAARALGQIDPKGSKKYFQEILEKAKGKKGVYDKKGKYKKVEVVYAREETVPAALALYTQGDKLAKSVVDLWLSVDVKNERLGDSNGFEMLFGNLAFVNEATMKKIKKSVQKAYKDLAKLGPKQKSWKLMQTRAAIMLAHTGDNTGLSAIIDAIEGNDNDLREAALWGLGGKPNYYTSYRAGAGGIKAGTGGLSKADCEKLTKAITKKMKFWNEKKWKTMGNEAILDIRARMKAAGL